jgi:mRNA interferase YafQ
VKTVVRTNAFLRDLRLAEKRGKDLRKLKRIIETLQQGTALAPRHCPHPLKGRWKPKWDCHIEPDWLLIYEVSETQVILSRTGTHADLFG